MCNNHCHRLISCSSGAECVGFFWFFATSNEELRKSWWMMPYRFLCHLDLAVTSQLFWNSAFQDIVSGLYICITQNRNLKYSLWPQYPAGLATLSFLGPRWALFLSGNNQQNWDIVEGEEMCSHLNLGLRLQLPAAGPEFPPDKNPAAVSMLCSEETRFQVRRCCQETERPRVLFLCFIYFS